MDRTLSHVSSKTVTSGRKPSFQHRFAEWCKGEFVGETRVGFWHPELHRIRHQVRKEWAKTTLILCTCILGILSLFWGSLYTVKDNLGALNVWIVDFDGQPPYTAEAPIVGPAIVEAARTRNASPQPHITYHIKPASYFNNDQIQVREAIYQEKAWSAIVINSNASTLLRAAVAGNTSYDPQGACQTIYVEARDQVAVDTYIVPELLAFQTSVVSIFAQLWLLQALNATDIAKIPHKHYLQPSDSPPSIFAVSVHRKSPPP